MFPSDVSKKTNHKKANEIIISQIDYSSVSNIIEEVKENSSQSKSSSNQSFNVLKSLKQKSSNNSGDSVHDSESPPDEEWTETMGANIGMPTFKVS